MGLCKCPKKKVTNQFCFEHRVNVCEHCMVSNHPKCVVQSYLEWLKDSDYNPKCELCQRDLASEDCIRLICYHVYHWECLNQHAASLPAHTAPAGYTCPSCKMGIFPTANMVSPVAECARALLSKASWARVGLDLPLAEPLEDSSEYSQISEVRPTIPNYPKVTQTPVSRGDYLSWTANNDQNHDDWMQNLTNGLQISPQKSTVEMNQIPVSPQRTEVVYSCVISGPTSPRRLYDASEEDSARRTTFDHDDNKYKRRSATEWLGKWFKLRTNPHGKHDPHRKFKRYIMISVLIVLGLFTLIAIFMRIGRATANDDPFLDPLANPQIKVNNNDEDS